jgi:hypothetical protein
MCVLLYCLAVPQAYWTLNEVSRELEDPFCFPPNDIPLARLQYQFNERILTAANTRVGGWAGGRARRWQEPLAVRLGGQSQLQATSAWAVSSPQAYICLTPVLPVLPLTRMQLPGSCMDGTYEAQLEEVVRKAAGGSLAAPDAGMSSDAELPAEGGDLAVDGKLPARVEAKQVELSV